MPKANSVGGVTYVGTPNDKDYYLQEAIRNAEELMVLASEMNIPADLDEERQGSLDMIVNEIKSRTNSLLIAIDPDREQEEDGDETDVL
jgi:hypothetical protein